MVRRDTAVRAVVEMAFVNIIEEGVRARNVEDLLYVNMVEEGVRVQSVCLCNR